MAPPKGPRRGPSQLSNVINASGPAPVARPTKSSKPSRLIRLKVPTKFLAGLDGQEKEASPASQESRSATPSKPSSGVTLKFKTNGDAANDGNELRENDTSLVEHSALPTDDETVKAGTKREADAAGLDDGKLKVKGGPRKRAKPGETGKIDGRTSAAKALGYVSGAHKLGPKANQGAINEKLRALDRTGKPCRKWGKATFKLKSFTGQMWEIKTWNSPQTRSFGVDTNSPGTSDNNKDSKDSKENSSSNVGSDRSPAVAQAETDMPSSPPVAAAA